MLGLPLSTEVNRRVAKEKIYSNANLTPELRVVIKDQIEAIIWRNKLADSTFNVSTGVTVSELQVFELQLRQRSLDKRVLTVIAKSIPYKILFILSFSEDAQAWIEVEGKLYNTDWQPLENMLFNFEGLNLDAIYEKLARQIAGGRLGASGDIAEAVELDNQQQKLKRDIASLERKVVNEKQFNKKVELNTELKRLKKQLEDLT